MDSYRLENCFDDLLNVFSDRNTSAFSSCLFSVKTNTSKPIDSFKKLCIEDAAFRDTIESSTKNMEYYKVRYTKFQKLINDSFGLTISINPFV